MAALRSSQRTNLNSQFSTFNSLLQSSITSSLRLLIPGWVNNVEQHGEEKIANQNRERGIHYRFSRGPTDADRAFACGQSFLATDEHDQYSKTECFRQAHDNIATTCPPHHVRHVIGAVNVEHENRNYIASSNADGNALRHQQWHRDHHGQCAWHYQIINRVNRESAQRINLLGHFHRADLG